MIKTKKDKSIPLPISKFIDTKFRDYSIHVISHRGIPSFYDALTPVQRYILMNSPSSYVKTLTVVGKCISDSYSHGDSSLTKAISRLARPFGSALQILEGYGFFGSEVCPEPAAARYTSVKLSPTVNEILKKYKYLTTRKEGEEYDPFWLDMPLGLAIPIVGIAVGYKTTILPRNPADIQKYFDGKIKSLKPYFIDFSGSIKKYQECDKAWILSSNITVKDNRIEIREIPPIIKYTRVLKKLDWLFNKFEGNIRLVNNSNTKVVIDIIYIGKSQDEWKEIQEFVSKTFSIIVREDPVFVKDGQVLVYDSVEQYLDDYKWQIKRLKYYNTLYERDFLSNELKFNIAKKEFITFILQKKRTIQEVDVFLKPYDDSVKDRLERLTSKKFTKDELESTSQKIIELTKELKIKEKELKIAKLEFEKESDPTTKRGISSIKVNVDLFDSDDVREIDGVTIWGGDDVFEEEETEVEKEGEAEE